MTIKVLANNVAVVTNPKPILMGNTACCDFVVGGTEHPIYSFTSMTDIKSVLVVVCYGRVAETALKYFRKGAIVDAEGIFLQRKFTSDAGEVVKAYMKADRVRLARPSNAADLMETNPLIDHIVRAWEILESGGDTDAMLRNDSIQVDEAPSPPRREDQGRRVLLG